jgi:hypothetical protein
MLIPAEKNWLLLGRMFVFFKDRHLLRYEHDGSLIFISAKVVFVLSF